MIHEKSEISDKEVKFFMALKASTGWVTSQHLATKSEVSPRSARMYALKFVRLGIADQAEVFPAHRYKLSDKASRRNVGQRLEQAIDVFGFAPVSTA
jgi:hypothetical protein